ncbi:MAG TPA: hypothetical protein VGL11_04890 [Candidatus Binatia bacterium]|jgi:hypothetical protein
MRNRFEKVLRFARSPVGIGLGFAFGVALGALAQTFGYSFNVAVVGKLAGVLALLGAFVGIIYAAYPDEASQIWHRPVPRTLVALGVAVTFVVAVHVSLVAAAICVAMFGAVGWLGTKRVYDVPR